MPLGGRATDDTTYNRMPFMAAELSAIVHIDGDPPFVDANSVVELIEIEHALSL